MAMVEDGTVTRARRYIAETVIGTHMGGTDPILRNSLIDLMCLSLKQAEERCFQLLRDHINVVDTEEEIKELHDFVEGTLTATFRQTNILLHEKNKGHGDDHVSVIRRLSPVIEEELHLEGTMLLDRLLQEDVLSETGRQSILAFPTKHAKDLAFINYMCGHFTEDTFVERFLPILGKDQEHFHLACEIEQELRRSDRERCHRPRCTFCRMKASVNPRRLADALFQMNSILGHVRRDLSSNALSFSTKWEVLLRGVDSEHALMKALEVKYPHLYMEFITTGHSAVACSCDDILSDLCLHHDDDVESDIGRLDDISSLEEEIPHQIVLKVLEERHRQYFSGGWIYTGILEDGETAHSIRPPHRFPWTNQRRGANVDLPTFLSGII